MSAASEIWPLSPGMEVVMCVLKLGLDGIPMAVHANKNGLRVTLGPKTIARGRNLLELRDSFDAWKSEAKRS